MFCFCCSYLCIYFIYSGLYTNKLAFLRCLPLYKMWNMMQYRAVASGFAAFYCWILQAGDMQGLLLLGHNWRWYFKIGAVHSSPVHCWLLPAKVDQFPCTCATNGCTTESTKYIKPCPWLQHFGVIVLPPLKVLIGRRLQEGGSSGEEKPSTTTTSLYAMKQVQEIRTCLFYSWLMMMMVCWELPQLPPWVIWAHLCSWRPRVRCTVRWRGRASSQSLWHKLTRWSFVFFFLIFLQFQIAWKRWECQDLERVLKCMFCLNVLTKYCYAASPFNVAVLLHFNDLCGLCSLKTISRDGPSRCCPAVTHDSAPLICYHAPMPDQGHSLEKVQTQTEEKIWNWKPWMQKCKKNNNLESENFKIKK